MHKNYYQKIKNYDWCFFFLLFLLFSIPYWFTTKDDAFIFLQVAKNIAHHGKFAFYLGRITNPITSHFWLLITVLEMKIFPSISPYFLLRIANVLCVFGIWYTYSKLVKSFISDYRKQFFCLFLLFIDPQLLRWSFIGMETPLIVFLLLLFFYLLYNQIHNKKISFLIPLVLLAGCTTRPEFLLVSILWGVYSLNSLWGKKEKRKKLSQLVSLGIFSFGYALYLYWQKIQFGYIWANPIRAKGLSSSSPSGWLFKYFLTWGGTYGLHYFLLICCLIFLLFNKKKFTYWIERKKELPFIFILLAWTFGVPFYYFSKGIFITDRYTILTGPFIILTIFYLLGENHKIISGKLMIYVGILFLIFSLSLTYFIQLPTAKTYTKKNKAIEKMGTWLKENTPYSEKVFFYDVGALGYYSERDIIDFLLVYPDFVEGKTKQALALKNMGCQYYVFRGDSQKTIRELENLFTLDHDRSFETVLEYEIPSKGKVFHLREKNKIVLTLAKAHY